VNTWGVHNNVLTTQLVDEGFISFGWDHLPNLASIPSGREGLKRPLMEAEPDAKARSIAGQAGVLTRFRDEMRVGDVVVAPYKPDSTMNPGVITSDYYFEAGAPTHRNRRRVEWKRTGLPRTLSPSPRCMRLAQFSRCFESVDMLRSS
jgi:restriction system protein